MPWTKLVPRTGDRADNGVFPKGEPGAFGILRPQATTYVAFSAGLTQMTL